MRKFIFVLLLIFGLYFLPGRVLAVSVVPSPTASASASPSLEPVITPAPDLTQKTQETLGPLEELLAQQSLGSVWPFNPLKYAIRGAIGAGVPANTIVLLLLLPVIATVIAASRHLIGLRGFGIFLPAALSVVFIATGPVLGIGLFILIILVSFLIRFILRKTNFRLQYLPRAALLLWAVSLSVLGVLFLAPVISIPSLANVSIFPILILVLLAEDFTRVQLGKSAKTAFNLTFETMILALLSYFFMTLKPIREYALLNPEKVLIILLGINLLLGKYVGLRFMEFIRFRKLIKS